MPMPTLYWSDSVAQDSAWENPLNWWLDSAATEQALNVPWLDGTDTTYLAFDLTYATGETDGVTMDVNSVGLNFGTGATGSCDIAGLCNNGNINGGTFTGDDLHNYGNINDGTFTGDSFGNYGGNINDGTFTGDSFGNYAGNINGGAYSGDSFGNYGTITDGTFTGGGFGNYGAINGGTYSGDSFGNYGGNIDGGTYSPLGTAALTQSSGTTFSVSLSVSVDPGFTNGGGTYSPVITTVIDNLISSNVADGVTILGIDGTYAASGGGSAGGSHADAAGITLAGGSHLDAAGTTLMLA